MHEDFRLNLIRMTLLKEAEKNHLFLDKLDVLFEDKGLGTVSRHLIQDEMNHLRDELYLQQLSTVEYQITDEGRQEYKEVKEAIDKF